MSERAADPAVALDAGAPLDELLAWRRRPFEGASPFPPIAD